MSEHGHMGIGYGPNDAGCHLWSRHGEGGVDARNHIVERGEDLVREIKGTILEDVALNAGENTKIRVKRVEFANLFDLGRETFFIEAIRLKRAFAVVRDADVIESEFLCGMDHILQRSPAIARGSMVVESAAKVRPFDKARKLVAFGSLDFPHVFTKLGLHGIQSKRTVNVVFLVNFGNGLEEFLSLCGTEAVFVQRPSTSEGA